MPRLAWKRGLLGKIEVTYGTDAAPVGATDAIEILGEVDVEGIDLESEEPEVASVSMGHDASVPVTKFKQIKFSCQLQSSGVLGTAPAMKALLRACGMTETINAGVDVQYDLNSAAADALTLKYNEDGEQHALLGARGTWELSFEAKKRPRINFTFVGIYSPLTDVAMPALTMTAWKKAVPMNNANTAPFTVHGYAAKLYSLTLALNNQFVKRNCVGVEDVLIVNRKPSGSLTIEKPTIAAFNYADKVLTGALGALSLTHGAAATLKVALDCPAWQFTGFKNTKIEDVACVELESRATRSAGNDEAKLTFK